MSQAPISRSLVGISWLSEIENNWDASIATGVLYTRDKKHMFVR